VFTVVAGTKCWVRKGFDGPWIRYRTVRDWVFDRYTLANNNGCWVFQHGDWFLKVATSLVQGRSPKQQQKLRRKGRPYSDRGRGVSRRRAQRSLRAARNRG
jgi:hypothetical protein